MLSKDSWSRVRLRLSPAVLNITFVLLSLAIVASKFQAVLPTSERWG